MSYFCWMKKVLLCLSTLLLLCHFANSTHLRAGYITYQKASGLTYQITVFVLTDTGSEVRFGDGFLDFGDGSQPIQLPQRDNVHDEELGPDVAYANFTIEHTFPSSGNYLISYVEPNRNEEVLNIDNSVNTTFSTQTFLVIDSFTTPDHISPMPLAPPVFRQNYNVDLSLSLAAADVNDWKLRYEFVVPQKEKQKYVDGYQMPKGVKLDSISGLMTWSKEDIQRQAQIGEYAFAVKISQYQLIDGDYKLKGYLIYDFQVILEEMQGRVDIENGTSSSLVSDNVFQISPLETDTIRYDISASDGEVFADVYSELTVDNLQWKVLGTGLNKQVELVVNVSEDIDRINPYIITVRASNDNDSNIHDINLRIYTQNVFEPDIIITALPEQIAAEKMTVFPNPVESKIYFTGSGITESYKIFTSTGQLISEGKAVDQIDVAYLNPGQYILLIGSNSYTITRK